MNEKIEKIERIIDLSKVISQKEIHCAIKKSGIEYCGENLDALYDVLTSICAKTSIKILHFDKIPSELKNYSAKLRRVFEDAQKENLNLNIEFC